MIGEPVLQEMPIQPKISLYIAQKTSLGFDLHLSDNEIITIILLQTSNKDVFLAKKIILLKEFSLEKIRNGFLNIIKMIN